MEFVFIIGLVGFIITGVLLFIHWSVQAYRAGKEADREFTIDDATGLEEGDELEIVSKDGLEGHITVEKIVDDRRVRFK